MYSIMEKSWQDQEFQLKIKLEFDKLNNKMKILIDGYDRRSSSPGEMKE